MQPTSFRRFTSAMHPSIHSVRRSSSAFEGMPFSKMYTGTPRVDTYDTARYRDGGYTGSAHASIMSLAQQSLPLRHEQLCNPSSVTMAAYRPSLSVQGIPFSMFYTRQTQGGRKTLLDTGRVNTQGLHMTKTLAATQTYLYRLP